jgi:hypothetical protein
MQPWFIPAYFKKTQASKLRDAQGIPFFINNFFFEGDDCEAKSPTAFYYQLKTYVQKRGKKRKKKPYLYKLT